jgi:Type IV secretion system pilin
MSIFNNFNLKNLKKFVLPLSMMAILVVGAVSLTHFGFLDVTASGLTSKVCPTADGCPGISNPEAIFGGTDDPKQKIADFLLGVAKFLTFIAVSVAVIFMVWGGYQWMNVTDPKGAEAGKTTVTNAAIGLAVAILAYTIVALLAGGLTGNWGAALGVGETKTETPSGTTTP